MTFKGEWKTNFGNPYSRDHYPMVYLEESYEQALARERKFFDSFVKGHPKATDAFTVEQLEDMGMVGLYATVSLVMKG